MEALTRDRVGSLFNAVRNAMIQRNIEIWIKMRFEGIWEELQKLGIRDTRQNNRVVRVGPALEP